MSYTFLPDADRTGAPGASPSEPAWAGEVERRILDRVDEWFSAELDDRVIRIVENRLRDETERRVWRGGPGVF
ncbi:hypothetical protein [Pseudactinotalea suaedae]|jgi:hypothetical protein|uniref:hypothetical protein n=1 Tax=Pseudactinotalea suaedae TaxID=1524924 RepID=UPI0012E18D30|nr:hypothetical protein [Pseudactinotalea suaedae]